MSFGSISIEPESCRVDSTDTLTIQLDGNSANVVLQPAVTHSKDDTIEVLQFLFVTHMRVAHPKLVSGSPGWTDKSKVKAMSHLSCYDRSLFFTSTGDVVTVGSE